MRPFEENFKKEKTQGQTLEYSNVWRWNRGRLFNKENRKIVLVRWEELSFVRCRNQNKEVFHFS